MSTDKDISAKFIEHYTSRVNTYGAAPKAVDWPTADIAAITYKKMLALIRDRHRHSAPGLLDVGCGYGGFLEFATQAGYQFDYTGIDIVPKMIDFARQRNPEGKFILGDAMDVEFDR